MSREKENVITPQAQELLRLMWDHLPATPEKLEVKRDLLRDWYLEWLHTVGCDLYPEEQQYAKNFFWQLDFILKTAQPILAKVNPKIFTEIED